MRASIFNSEQFWQPNHGVLALSTTLEIETSKEIPIFSQANDFTFESVSGKTVDVDLVAEYGILNTLLGDYSLGVNLGYRQFKNDIEVADSSSAKNEPSGLEDIAFELKGRWLLATFNYSWHYGVKYGVSPENRIISSEGEKGFQSGGNFLEYYLGAQYLFEFSTLGIEYRISVPEDRTVESQDSSGSIVELSKISEGRESRLTLFYEIPYETYLLGFRVQSISKESSILTRAAGDQSESGEFNSLVIGAYLSIDLAPWFVLVPGVEHETSSAKEFFGADISGYQNTRFSFTGRMAF